MSKAHSLLSTITLRPQATYCRPQEPVEIAHWEDPALHVMIDFKYLKAATIAPNEAIDTALLEMKASGFHELLVTDKEHHVIGLITSEDLLSEKPLKAIQEKRLPRSDIEIHMLMTPAPEILTFNIENLHHAKVEHVVNTLQAHRKHCALVVKVDNHHAHIIRGLFSSTQISRQLGKDITNDLNHAQSLAELQHDLHLND